MGDKGSKYIEKIVPVDHKKGRLVAIGEPSFLFVPMMIRGEPVWLCSLLRIRVC